jgi:dTDP-glucose 4,6-dehydratase
MFLANKALEGEPLKYSAGVKMPLRINVAGESEIKNDDMAFMIADILGVKANISYIDFHSTRPGHDSRYSLDPSKLAELGWKAPVSLQESLKKTVEWTMQHPEWLE